MITTKWENGLGWNVTINVGWNVTTNDGKLRFEVWPTGLIVRTVDDPDSMCGFRGTHYIELGREAQLPTVPEMVIDLCERLWKDRREQWTEIEMGPWYGPAN